MRGHSDRVKGWRGGRGSGGGEKEGEAEGEEEGGLCGCNHRGFLERRVDGCSWEPRESWTETTCFCAVLAWITRVSESALGDCCAGLESQGSASLSGLRGGGVCRACMRVLGAFALAPVQRSPLARRCCECTALSLTHCQPRSRAAARRRARLLSRATAKSRDPSARVGRGGEASILALRALCRDTWVVVRARAVWLLGVRSRVRKGL